MNDNVEKLCEVTRVLKNGEKMYTFPIINLQKKIVFVFAYFSGLK